MESGGRKIEVYACCNSQIALCVIVAILIKAEGAKNVSWPCQSTLQGWGSMATALTGKFVFICNIYS